MNKLMIGLFLILSSTAFAASSGDQVLVYQDGGTVYVDISGSTAQQIFEQLPVKSFDNGAAVMKTTGTIDCTLFKQSGQYRCTMLSN